MNGNGSTAGDWITIREELAAELTSAAYGIALRHGTRGSWVDLELALWRVLDETVRKWGRELTRAGRPGCASRTNGGAGVDEVIGRHRIDPAPASNCK